MRKNKLLLLLALLMTAATGAWAQTVVTIGNGTDDTSFVPYCSSYTNSLVEQIYLASEIGQSGIITAISFNIFEQQDDITNSVDVYMKNVTRSSFSSTTDYEPLAASDMVFSGSVNYKQDGWNTITLDTPFEYDNTKNLLICLYKKGSTKYSIYNYYTTQTENRTIAFYHDTNVPDPYNLGSYPKFISVVTNRADIKITMEDLPAPTYSVTMKDGVKDADKWTITPNEGLKGDGSETVTLKYNGRLKVKGVKATSDAGAAAPSVPDGAINGKFSVSDGKQVYFSKGNLRYASSKWSFFDNQYDYYTGYSADAWDHFGWSTSATTYGMNTSTDNGDYSGDFVDWGATMGTGWFTLSKDEWTYLFKTRSASTVGGTENGRYAKAKVNNVPGIILFPDTYTHPDGVTAPVGVNATGDTGWNGNSYTVADWTKMESAGCVFLPAAGYREGSSVTSPGSYGYYWSATPSGTNNAYRVYSNSRNLNPENTANRRLGLSVRLVCEGATSDAPAVKPAATVTTAPTATTGDIAAGSETALVSGGAATGGTMMYKVTTANTKPTSTEGFSATVPTAKTLAAGTFYVWYYVKADDSHTDSEISATGIEVTIAAAVATVTITWNSTNVFNSSNEDDQLDKWDTTPLTYEGIKISFSGSSTASGFFPYNGVSARLLCYGDSFTFTAPSGKQFTKIVITDNVGVTFTDYGDWKENTVAATWSGTPSNTVTLGSSSNIAFNDLKSIVFTLVDAE